MIPIMKETDTGLKSCRCFFILFIYLFIYLFKNSTQYKQYKIKDTIKAVEF